MANTQLSVFLRFCEQRCHGRFEAYADFERWAIQHAAEFWTLLLQWSGLSYEGSATPAITDPHPERAHFFPNLRLGYVENLLHVDQPVSDRPALTAVHWDGTVQRWSFAALRSQVASLSRALRAQGLRSGEHVALIAHNGAPAVVAALAAAALGCPVATAAPELAPEALLARLSQIEPVLLISDIAASSAVLAAQRRAQLADVAHALPSLRAVLLLGDDTVCVSASIPVQRACDLIGSEPALFERADLRRAFDHPLFILFTSGTTGPPKCLVHGAGGSLMEHVKEHRLHCDLSSSDKLFFHTSIGWMMWHWQLSALASGVEIVLYDGPASAAESLWRIVAHERVTVFGTSPAYLQLCQRSNPGLDGLDFASLRAVLSTGSVLYCPEQDWVSQHIKPLPVQSISGGTDIIGCFLLGNPNLAAYSAECQCRSLALDVRAIPHPSTPAAAIGELVCTNPFPSRPLGMLHDPLGARFHSAYFEQHEGCWTHGDLVEFTPEGSAILHGRCDGVLNIRGIRIGPAEIYRILRRLPEICEAMAVEQQAPEEIGGSRMVLLIVLQGSYRLDAPLIKRIQQELLMRGSPAHVPDLIVQVPELPSTYSGKPSERSARDALNGVEPRNAQALRNPASLEPLRRFRREQYAASAAPPDSTRAALTLELMTQIWEQVLGLNGLGPDANFFELSGNSLTALRMMRELQRLSGRELALSLLYEAPTLRGLLEAVNAGGPEALPPGALRLLNEAAPGAPLFFVPGIGGSAMELQPLARALPVPVYGLEARGLHPLENPHECIEDMAAAYVSEIHTRFPTGPYYLAGYSFGGLVAYQMARLMASDGDQIALLALLDTTPHQRFWPAAVRAEYLVRRGRRAVRRMRGTSAAGLAALAREACTAMRALVTGQGALLREPQGPAYSELPAAVVRVREAAFRAFARYRPRPSSLPLLLIRSDLSLSERCDPALFWQQLVPLLSVEDVAADHYRMLRTSDLASIAACLATQVLGHHEQSATACEAARPSRAAGEPVQPVML